MNRIYNKKGVSEIVSYVLLISMTLAISGVIYAWLVFYVTPGQEIKCDEGVSLTIQAYNYNCTTGELNLSLQNRGMFNIDGYLIRVNNKSGSKIGVYSLNKTGTKINTSEVYDDYYLDSHILDSLGSDENKKEFTGNITFIEIQPFVNQDGYVNIFCDSIAKQKIECSQ